MPPKGPARVGLGRPAGQQNTSYVRSAINEITSQENRSVVVAVSFFAVSISGVLRERGRARKGSIGDEGDQMEMRKETNGKCDIHAYGDWRC